MLLLLADNKYKIINDKKAPDLRGFFIYHRRKMIANQVWVKRKACILRIAGAQAFDINEFLVYESLN
ncbi:hypothetical protein [Xanthocytophaga agilis]|uniref:Uncharacterized protein n=1 Tax=Xanthocytophaga agilis TaxID=3048010 RepID=A0AAE3R9D8_9BACT|nr:hypothetical protein [Xanthocytophaga agilis]MDJ1503889.1 hypothetical protein [Xanthocytophaga agilis]